MAAAGLVIILVYVLIHSLPPKAILEDADLYNIHRVEFVSENNNYIDVTNQIDLDKLKDIISKYQCSRTTIKIYSYSVSLVDYEINGTYNDKPLHIILGDFNVVYESGNSGGHLIENSAALISEIDELIGK